MDRIFDKNAPSRRNLLLGAGAGLAGLAAAACSRKPEPAPAPEGITATTIRDAEALTGITYTDAERAQMVADLEARLGALQQLREKMSPLPR